jgi:hypothetical protein
MAAIDGPQGESRPGAGAPAGGSGAPAPTWSDDVKAIGGLLAVTIGALVVGAISIIALIKNTSTASTIASAASGVVATIDGAYFGVKVGADQSKAAIEGARAESAKAQVYAAHLPPGDAPGIVEMAETAAKDVLARTTK